MIADNIQTDEEFIEKYRINYTILYDSSSTDEQKIKAFEWFWNNREKDNARIWHIIAKCFFRGFGTEKNYEKAVEWYKKAANKGYPQSLYQLGLCYRNGRGVPINASMVRHYMSLAAEQGYKPAEEFLQSDFERQANDMIKSREKLNKKLNKSYNKFRKKF